jgi:hypothetical protein
LLLGIFFFFFVFKAEIFAFGQLDTKQRKEKAGNGRDKYRGEKENDDPIKINEIKGCK